MCVARQSQHTGPFLVMVGAEGETKTVSVTFITSAEVCWGKGLWEFYGPHIPAFGVNRGMGQSACILTGVASEWGKGPLGRGQKPEVPMEPQLYDHERT